MRTHNFFKLIFFILLVTACSSDNDNDEEEPQNNDINITIDEYPSSGTFLSDVTSDLSGTVTYSIISQSSNTDAIIFSSGNLSVGDWLAYDYETNTELTAVIGATNGSETETINVTVTINNIDDIWAFLGEDSRSSYENANNGDWVAVNQGEYNNLANYLFDVNRSGQIESVFNNTSTILVGGADFTVAINDAPKVSSGQYLYAFKYYCDQNGTTDSNVKLSETSYQSDFLVKGNNLPMHDFGYNFFVLKGNNDPTANTAYLGIYESNTIGYKIVSGEAYFFEPGDSGNITNNGAVDRGYLYQGLSTTVKQWD